MRSSSTRVAAAVTRRCVGGWHCVRVARVALRVPPPPNTRTHIHRRRHPHHPPSAHAQAKNVKSPGSLAGWPVASVKVVLKLLENAKANADVKELDEEMLYISHISCQQAPKGRRRTYRAHGRINPYMSQPSHIELVLTQKNESVAKAKTEHTLPIHGKRRLAAQGLERGTKRRAVKEGE